jgi:hypothetical protein
MMEDPAKMGNQKTKPLSEMSVDRGSGEACQSGQFGHSREWTISKALQDRCLLWVGTYQLVFGEASSLSPGKLAVRSDQVTIEDAMASRLTMCKFLMNQLGG